ncbi:gliding motility-associated C-terminal domain-containing protein [Pedobacter sp. P351]|uniref:gliding motility-associated C-terminal domain-containing protein n=1 Tax=Pedobacter superstes TaxID=3133441 RepID=UPI0030994030
MMKRTKILLSVFCLFCLSSNAQLVNSDQIITLTANSLVYVSDAFTNTKGTVLNNGKLEVKGNFSNSDLNSFVFDGSSNGVVALSGGTQEVGGATKTVFPDLALSGTGDKFLKTNADVAGVLSLGNKQLHANEFTLHILNPSPNAIIRSDDISTPGTGFISTDLKGNLVRNTNTNLPYIFPLGSSLSNPALASVNILYRPLQFKPEDSGVNTFSASLLNYDPTNDGFDKTKKRDDVRTVSNKYYYLLSQKAGASEVDVTFYQSLVVDQTYSQLVNWTNFLQWEKATPVSLSAGTFEDDLNNGVLNRSISFNFLQPFQNLPFTLSSDIDVVNPFTFYNAFSPDGDNKNDTWPINNIELYPDNKLSIFNRWGDEVLNIKGYTNDKAWDGGNLQSGTYYYILTATIENQPRVFKGFITMINKN